MGVINGMLGLVNGVANTRNWQVKYNTNPQEIISSASKGGVDRFLCVRDWTGSYAALGGVPASMPGAALTFKGVTDQTSGAQKGCYGTAIVESVSIAWDLESGAPIAHTVNFAGNGVLTCGTVSGITGDSGTIPDGPLGTLVFTGGPTNIQRITLTITARNAAYSSSGTSGWKNRVKGAIDATLAIAALDEAPDLSITPVSSLEIATGSAWTFGANSWALIDADVNDDIQGAGLVVVNYNWGFKSNTGTITVPGGGTTWFPAAA